MITTDHNPRSTSLCREDHLLATITMLRFNQLLLLLCIWSLVVETTTSFSIVFMAKRGKKGGLQRTLNDDESGKTPKSSRSFNQGRGQEITGVTLPADGRIKGWEFGEGVRMVCANVNGKFYALQVRSLSSTLMMMTWQAKTNAMLTIHPSIPKQRENVPVVVLIYGKEIWL